MKKIGLITYHSAYNYGSVYQAYALQEYINKLECQCEIINYRMPTQDAFYKTLRFNYGMKVFIKDFMLLKYRKQREIRNQKFESFFSQFFHLTKVVKEPEDAINLMKGYDIMISGSDQIWNKYSDELYNADWRYMNPYLLKGYFGKKISYASSIGGMTDEDINYILPSLRDFNCVSFREEKSATYLKSLLDMNIKCVLDPTFLLKAKDWANQFCLNKNDEHYILYYTLDGFNQMKERRGLITRLADKFNCNIILVTPLINYNINDDRVTSRMNLGPIEFLRVLYNADHVITDSYHGTIMSINFGKDVYSLCRKGGAEYRKTEVLNRLKMNERIVGSLLDILNYDFADIDYISVQEILDDLREKSINYLKQALDIID